ncbi:cupin domain-containing protein [Streptomyces sp. NPDC002577]
MVRRHLPGSGALASAGEHVRFAPVARTAWHSHGLGQTLYIVEGIALIQSRGGEILEARPGDVIYTPPGEAHWHGAASDHCGYSPTYCRICESTASPIESTGVSDTVVPTTARSEGRTTAPGVPPTPRPTLAPGPHRCDATRDPRHLRTTASDCARLVSCTINRRLLPPLPR